jgi:hypothetical protein
MRMLVSVFLLLVPCTAGLAATSEGYGMGGWMARFQPVIDQANQSGELFRITGHCQSISPRWTAHFMSVYNAPLRQYLTAGRYMETLAFHTVSGAAMIDRFGYRECPRK